jgi:hypothetical protein
MARHLQARGDAATYCTALDGITAPLGQKVALRAERQI